MRRERPPVLLRDLMLPDFNGWNVYREMKKGDELAEIPVIVVAAKVPTRNKIIIDDLPPVDDPSTRPLMLSSLFVL
jgi:DNA-binding response OmpR family regulator